MTEQQQIARLKAALRPFAEAARTLDHPGVSGYPFDDPNEVLWAGERGVITVRDFRFALAVLEPQQ